MGRRSDWSQGLCELTAWRMKMNGRGDESAWSVSKRSRTRRLRMSVVALAACLGITRPAVALDGDIRCHDPSTVAVCDGRYYVFSTGRGIPVLASEDGWTWRRAGRVFEHIPDSLKAVVPLNKNDGVW